MKSRPATQALVRS